MPYLIYAVDFPGMENKREECRQAHRDFLKSYGNLVLASGALLEEDGTIIGGVSLLDTEDKTEAERFAYDDPYAKAGIRVKTIVQRWRRRWWEGVFLGNS